MGIMTWVKNVLSSKAKRYETKEEKEEIEEIMDEHILEKNRELRGAIKEKDIFNMLSVVFNRNQIIFTAYRRLLKAGSKCIDDKERELGHFNCCQKGCSYCCGQAIFVSGYEADIINKVVYNNAYSDSIYINALKYVDALREAGLTEQVLAETDSKEANEKVLSLNLKCPCLGPNEECLIYENRPITCMAYRNYSCAEDCHGRISPYSISFPILDSVLLLFRSLGSGKQKKDVFKYRLLPFVIASRVRSYQMDDNRIVHYDNGEITGVTVINRK